jgi:hypothetical protein
MRKNPLVSDNQCQSVAVFADEPEEIPSGDDALKPPCLLRAMVIAKGFPAASCHRQGFPGLVPGKRV